MTTATAVQLCFSPNASPRLPRPRYLFLLSPVAVHVLLCVVWQLLPARLTFASHELLLNAINRPIARYKTDKSLKSVHVQEEMDSSLVNMSSEANSEETLI
ncbi:unnamed protein product [Ceratitis capitata]|uniref:(Mediterranean fruit fly) hypothetical protein n=1 Tax=Ceratitis capitata TaxID=7213 RepID=A0A811V319_CERCA|nr:unnamed protein product [Ceratitis capitata]